MTERMTEEELAHAMKNEGQTVVPRCGDCVNFEDPKDPKLNYGECRRYPPTFRLKGQQAGAVSVYEAESAWPVLNKDSWCVGEFRPKEQRS